MQWQNANFSVKSGLKE